MKKCPKCGKIAEFYEKSAYCKKCEKERRIEYYRQHNTSEKQKQREYRQKYPERVRAVQRKSRIDARLEALRFYSKGEPKCICCGEKEIKFLAFDHINGGGAQHLQQPKVKGNLYYWLKKNNYPNGFQILCHNCNCAKGFYGKCPHNLSEGGLGTIVDIPTPEQDRISRERTKDFSLEGILKKNKE